jgi:hypothetical protein
MFFQSIQYFGRFSIEFWIQLENISFNHERDDSHNSRQLKISKKSCQSMNEMNKNYITQHSE